MVTTRTTQSPASSIRPVPPVAGEDRLVLTVTEAGRLLGISRAFAYELAARGELPVIRLGRRLLVPKRPLLELVGAISHPPVGAAVPGSDSPPERPANGGHDGDLLGPVDGAAPLAS